MRPLPSQKPPSLFQMGYKDPGSGAVCVFLPPKAHTSENGATGWRGPNEGTQGDFEAGRGVKQLDRRKFCSHPKKAS